jgi:hypothetical protein
MLSDPLRYILTTSDGTAEDYNNLPSNIQRVGDCTYENPFLNSLQTIELPQSNGASQLTSTEPVRC